MIRRWAIGALLLINLGLMALTGTSRRPAKPKDGTRSDARPERGSPILPLRPRSNGSAPGRLAKRARPATAWDLLAGTDRSRAAAHGGDDDGGGSGGGSGDGGGGPGGPDGSGPEA